MEHILLEDGTIQHAAKRAAEVLRAGGVVLYPTDTLYGLGVDALSDVAVGKIYGIKGRDDKKPLHAIVADIAMAQKYADADGRAVALVQAFGGKVTIVAKKRSSVGAGIARGLDTFGFRIPLNAFCIALAKEFGGPITATSANKSGLASARNVEDILAQLGEQAKKIDLVVDAGALPERQASTVVDMSGPTPHIVRESAVSGSEILSVLNAFGGLAGPTEHGTLAV